MAIAADICDCAPCGRGPGRSFESPGVTADAGPAPPERCCRGPQPPRGMPRLHQVRRIRRQETAGIAGNVRALFEWTVRAPADAASLLGCGTPFRGKLEAFGVGKNLFGAGGLRKFDQGIRPLLNACGSADGSHAPMQALRRGCETLPLK